MAVRRDVGSGDELKSVLIDWMQHNQQDGWKT